MASPPSSLILSENSLFRWTYFWGKGQLLKAKIAVALHDELGRVPKTEEIEQVFLLSRVMYKAILGLHYKRQEQKKTGQLAIF
jgi:hypothetical protein